MVIHDGISVFRKTLKYLGLTIQQVCNLLSNNSEKELCICVYTYLLNDMGDREGEGGQLRIIKQKADVIKC